MFNYDPYEMANYLDIIAQIVSASIAGDMVLVAAYAHELPRYGLEVRLTNYAAAYCTRLLLARRLLKTLEMDEEYKEMLRKHWMVDLTSHITLMEDEPEKYQTHFSKYIKRGIDEDGLEEMYKKVHAAICADPTLKKYEKQPPKEHKR
ncbi:60S ribosomal protein L5-2 [Abeliophyllum distichum]|uniref:60S ribosomal protein L5-2 n=1 Tax=Abeliophyllum distichum TaxID=126358 RepID=A0ABD1QI52_9LAMI